MIENQIKNTIRDVPDFPTKGIVFKDITPILAKPALCGAIVDEFKASLEGTVVDAIAAVESRGFLFGFLLAQKLNVPLIMVRKSGKLPYKTNSYSYELEYGKAVIEMHVDAVKPGQRILIHDDLLATGGTAIAAAELVKQEGGVVAGFAFVVELGFLNGRTRLKGYSDNIMTLARY